MRNGDLLAYTVAKRGLILAALLIPGSVLGFAEPITNPATEQQVTQTEQAQHQPDIAPTVQEKTPEQPVPDESGAKSAQYYERADFDAQVRMAEASEELVKLTDRQFWATLVEMILLIGAVSAAVWAAWAASKAAYAAQEAVEVTSETAKQQLRAYLTVGACTIDFLPDDSGLMLSAHITNSGITPAFNTRIMGESFASDYPLSEPMPHPTPGTDFGAPIGAGGELICAQRLFSDDLEAAINRVKAGEIGMWIQGAVIYDDCFGDQHSLRFRYVFGGRLANTGGIILHADKDGNYAD